MQNLRLSFVVGPPFFCDRGFRLCESLSPFSSQSILSSVSSPRGHAERNLTRWSNPTSVAWIGPRHRKPTEGEADHDYYQTVLSSFSHYTNPNPLLSQLSQG